MNEEWDVEPVDDTEDLELGDYISDLMMLFVPTLEEEEWAWWPNGHPFANEWEQGALWEIALDSAFRSPLNDLPSEMLAEAVAIGEEGVNILDKCETGEQELSIELLVATGERNVLAWIQEAADVAVSCFELGELLSQPMPEVRGDLIATELYGSSDDWVIPLAYGLVGLKLHRLGPEFEAAMRAWYDQFLARARAHYE
ncbi:MAG: hypothetical protein JXM73_17300 [Anaerolineae bacterium]|nr:hypothetical protein [Anaerolineae bacterium]